MTKVLKIKNNRQGNVARMAVFGVILLIVIIGAIWEFALTLPGYQNAMANLETISKANMTDARTRADVVEVISADPAKTEYKKIDISSGQGGEMYRHQRVDRYQWTRVIPGKKKLELVVTYEYLPPKGDSGKDFKPESCADADWNFKYFYEPGNAPANVTVKGAKPRPIEERVFLIMDEDGDSAIGEKEMAKDSSILKQMDLFDPDGDKKISLDEFKAAIKKLEEKKGSKLSQDELYGFFGGESPMGMMPAGGGDGKGAPGKGGKGKGKKGGKGGFKGKRPEGDSSGDKKGTPSDEKKDDEKKEK